MRTRIWLFLKLTRPLFLVGGVLMYILGAAIAWSEGAPVRWIPLWTGQVLVTCIQLMTHYANEYFDQESDRLNEQRTWFSGGSGVLTSSSQAPGVSLAPSTALVAARVAGGVGIVFLVLAGMQVPILILPGIAALLAAWYYSAPPLSLSGSGWGETTASLVVAGLVPMFGYATQTGAVGSPYIVWVCLCLGLIHLAMLIAFEIPDYPSDLLAGKRTLAVRFGTRRAAHIHNLSLLLAFAITLAILTSGLTAARFAILSVPLALWQSITIYRYLTPGAHRYLYLTLPALALFALTAALWLAGFA